LKIKQAKKRCVCMFSLVARGRRSEKSNKTLKGDLNSRGKKHIAWCSNFVGDEKFMRHFQVLPD
jgi:hypothetical protein